MKAIGIILAGGKYHGLGSLIEKRNTAAIPVGSCYRSIDFALSNMSNSGIKKVAVIAQHNTRSLTDHLSSSKWWDLGRKKGGLFLFTPDMSSSTFFGFKGTGDAIYQNISFLKRSNEPYVIIGGGEQIHRMDYNKLIAYHQEKGADITIVSKKMTGQDVRGYGVLELDEDNRMINFEEKPFEPQHDTVSMGTYIISRDLLITLLEEIHNEGRYNIVNDIFIRYRKKLKIYAYMFEGYWRSIRSIEEYYSVNMEFLKEDVRELFFKTEPHFFTKIKDEAPAKFNVGSKVTKSLLGGGVISNGTVDNSVLFRKVYVGDQAIVRDSIIMENTTIGRNCIIEYAIIDKNVVISDNQVIVGTRDNLVVISKDTIR